jgi:bifunctional DNase/RNase
MIEVTVGGLVPDQKTGTSVLLLRIPGGKQHLPVWIGPHEAEAIRLAITRQSLGRPLTHDLLKRVLDGLGAKLERVVITTIQDSTFFDLLILTRDPEIISIDARPSDSVALALRTGAPIFLTQELLDSQKENLYEIETTEGDESDDDENGTLERDLDQLMRSVEKGEIPPAQGESES